MQLPLVDLSPETASFAAARTGLVSIAAVDAGGGAVYTLNDDLALPMASVAKLPIMITLMDQALQEDRELTFRECGLLERMITVSDNTAASILWDEVGGGEAVHAYLQSIGLDDFAMSASDAWGESAAPARSVALLLTKLVAGEILNESFRMRSLELMGQVVPAQRWGVPAGLAQEALESSFVGVKDGWYPGAEGWRVNSAGIVLPADANYGYVIVVMTDEQPSMRYGITTIEQVASSLELVLGGQQSDRR